MGTTLMMCGQERINLYLSQGTGAGKIKNICIAIGLVCPAASRVSLMTGFGNPNQKH
jgi:hypothetical protein